MRITWTYEEIVLAAQLAERNRWRSLDPTDRAVIELSRVLRESLLHPLEGRDPTFRNADGVSRKTVDIVTRHPDYLGKPTNGNQYDSIVLAKFLENSYRMNQEADSIRLLMSSSVQFTISELSEDVSSDEGRLLFSSTPSP